MSKLGLDYKNVDHALVVALNSNSVQENTLHVEISVIDHKWVEIYFLSNHWFFFYNLGHNVFVCLSQTLYGPLFPHAVQEISGSVGDEDRQKQYVAEIRQKIISTHVIHVTKNSIRQRTQRMQRAVWAH